MAAAPVSMFRALAMQVGKLGVPSESCLVVHARPALHMDSTEPSTRALSPLFYQGSKARCVAMECLSTFDGVGLENVAAIRIGGIAFCFMRCRLICIGFAVVFASSEKR